MSAGHVIEFTPGGAAVAMHNDGFDLSFLGRQSIRRETEIKFNETTQRWDICEPMVCVDDYGTHYPMCQQAAGFMTYEGARKVEVAWLNYCRLRGVPPTSPDGVLALTDIRKELGE